MTYEYDDAAVLCFLKNQRQLFPENVVENESEAEAFLEECMAVIAESAEEVLEYFEEQGIDTSHITRCTGGHGGGGCGEHPGGLGGL